MTRRLALLLLTLAACHDDVQTYTDEGRVCVEPEALAHFQAGDTLELTVTAPDCISACARVAQAECSAVVMGERIVVTSNARWAPSDEVCITLCAALQAHCEVTIPEAGHYTLVHGDDELPLELPSTPEAPPCTALPNAVADS